MAGILSTSDFTRLRDEAERRRSELESDIQRATEELRNVEGYLERLVVTESMLISAPSGGDAVGGLEVDDIGHDRSLATMVRHVLRLDFDQAKREGRAPGMKPLAISREIKRLFGEEVTSRAVNSHVWYLYSQKRISKVGSKYSVRPVAANSGSLGGEVNSTSAANDAFRSDGAVPVEKAVEELRNASGS